MREITRTPAQTARRIGFLALTIGCGLLGVVGLTRSGRDAIKDVVVEKAAKAYEEKAASFEKKDVQLRSEYDSRFNEQERKLEEYKKENETERQKIKQDYRIKLEQLEKAQVEQLQQQKKLYDEEVAATRREFDENISALERKFFGVLPSFENASDKSILTPLERELILNVQLADEWQHITESANSFYNLTLHTNSLQMFGSLYWDIKDKERLYHLNLQTLNITNNSIVFNHHYHYSISTNFLSENPRYASLSRVLHSCVPFNSVIFGKSNEVLVINHEKEFSKWRGNKLLIKGDTQKILLKYRTNAVNVLNDFRVIYQRGPNLEQSEE